MNVELEDYILAHIDPEPTWLRQLDRHTHQQLLYPQMCSGHLQGRMLKMLTAMAAPRRVLEIGTYSGYSALCIAEALTGDATLDTVEINDEHEEFIRRHFELSPHATRITLHIGDARHVVDKLGKTWDMAYVDANKRQYCEYYELVLRHLEPGGFVIFDNTLWYDKVSRGARDAQTRAIEQFNDLVAGDSRVEKVIVPVRDGLTIIRVKPQ